MAARLELVGRLVLEDRVGVGRILIEDDRIAAVDVEPRDVEPRDVEPPDVPGGAVGPVGRRGDGGPLVAPGFVDVHVHGWGGHDAMGEKSELDGMARALAHHGVTAFLPTGVTSPLDELARFADRVRGWMPVAAADGAAPLGFNLEGPFLAAARKGAHDPTHLRDPADVDGAAIEPLVEGLRLITVAPELPGALELVAAMHARGVRVSLGHSAATFAQAQAGYAAGATSTTHLFNAMTGVEHRAPGLAVAALTDDGVYTELIADGVHVDRAVWPLITRAKPVDRVLLVSDAISLAGVGDGRARIGGLEVEVVGDRVTVAGTTTLAGSVIALDTAVRNLVAAGIGLPAAVAAASRNPAAMLGVSDRGRIAVGQVADLVELDADLRVARVMRAGRWLDEGA